MNTILRLKFYQYLNRNIMNEDLYAFQADHLLLLIGSNPVPNALAGKYLVTKGGTVHLFHTRQTIEIVESLQRFWAQHHQGLQVALHMIDTGSAEGIGQTIRAVLEDIDASKTVSLHYTGGTKAMAVHAHRAMREWVEENDYEQEAPFYTYLDANTFTLYRDDAQKNLKLLSRNKVLMDLPLEDLSGLHGWLKEAQRGRKEVFAQPLVEAICSIPGDFMAQIWSKHWVEPILKNNKQDTIIPIPQSCLKTSNPDIKDGFKRIQEGLTTLFKACPRALVPIPMSEKEQIHKYGGGLSQLVGIDFQVADSFLGCKAGEFWAWLNAKWLESAVHYALLNHIQVQPYLNAGAYEVFQGIEFLHGEGKRTRYEKYEIKFELDVVLVRGYQVFGFSCTTHTGADENKGELMKTLHRLRQIGGDEARAAIVTFYDAPTHIKEELHSLFGNKYVTVLGKDDLFPRGARVSLFDQLGAKLAGFIQSTFD